MNKVERFLNSKYYIALIFGITFIAWLFYKETPPLSFNLYNMIGIFFFAVALFVVLAFFENTLYAAPLLLPFLFIINKRNMDFSTAVTEWWIYIALFLVIAGPIVHYLRFRPTIKKGHFTLGLTLIAISYLLSTIQIPFLINAIPVSILGLLYLFFYLYLTASTKGRISYIFYIFLFLNFLFIAQLGVYIYRGFLLNPDLPLAQRLLAGWGRNLGWANVNDMCFYIALTLPANLYFIMKNAKRNWPLWFVMILGMIVVLLSQSRGGIMSFSLSVIGMAILIGTKGRRRVVIQMLIALALVTTLFLGFKDVFSNWFDEFMRTTQGSLNEFTTNRLKIYETGLEIFFQKPIFGGGWLSLDNVYPNNRLFMYHSTIIQALAAMGLMGLVALIVHYIEVIKFFFKRITFEKWLFMIGYLASQIHGLIDNVQYAVPYSVIMIVVFSIWEKAPIETEFYLINQRYYHGTIN
ncbi:MAG: O-antigen ligase family protein [Acholeplasmataceae bacterium]